MMLTRLSRDGTVLVTGSKFENSDDETVGNPVRAYKLGQDSWVQLGNDLMHDYLVSPRLMNNRPAFPSDIAISSGGHRIAVNAPGEFEGQGYWQDNQVGVLVYEYNETGKQWAQVGKSFHFYGGAQVDMSADGNIVLVSKIRSYTYFDTLAASYTNIGENWILSGGVSQIEPMNRWDDEDMVALSPSGSFFAYVTTVQRDNGQPLAGVFHVFHYLDRSTDFVESCLPDPALLDSACHELIGENNFQNDEDDEVMGFNMTTITYKEEKDDAVLITAIVLAIVAMVMGCFAAMGLFTVLLRNNDKDQENSNKPKLQRSISRVGPANDDDDDDEEEG